MASAKAEIAVGWLTVGLVVGGIVGLSVHNPDPEVRYKTKVEVVHIPSPPLTHKEVVTKYVQRDLPESCKFVPREVSAYTSVANRYDILAKTYYDAAQNKADPLELFEKHQALNTKLYEVLQQKDRVSTAVTICETDIKRASE